MADIPADRLDFSSGLATLKARRIDGLLEFSLGGLVTQERLLELRICSIPHVRRESSIVHHGTRAVFLMDKMNDEPTMAPWGAPCAYVCTPGQWAMYSDYAARASRIGAARVVFLADQVEDARQWARDYALAIRRRPRSLPPTTPGIASAGL